GVAVLFAAARALWLASSANGRYGMVVLLLAGVCLARVVERLLPSHAARVTLAVLLAVQVGISVIASPPRWFISDEWSRRWFPFEVPQRALRDPADVERERKISALFDRIEKACSRLLRGQTGVTEPLGSGWSRNYSGLDARLEALSGRALLHRYRTETTVDLGPLSGWEQSEVQLPAPCKG